VIRLKKSAARFVKFSTHSHLTGGPASKNNFSRFSKFWEAMLQWNNRILKISQTMHGNYNNNQDEEDTTLSEEKAAAEDEALFPNIKFPKAADPSSPHRRLEVLFERNLEGIFAKKGLSPEKPKKSKSTNKQAVPRPPQGITSPYESTRKPILKPKKSFPRGKHSSKLTTMQQKQAEVTTPVEEPPAPPKLDFAETNKLNVKRTTETLKTIKKLFTDAYKARSTPPDREKEENTSTPFEWSNQVLSPELKRNISNKPESDDDDEILADPLRRPFSETAAGINHSNNTTTTATTTAIHYHHPVPPKSENPTHPYHQATDGLVTLVGSVGSSSVQTAPAMIMTSQSPAIVRKLHQQQQVLFHGNPSIPTDLVEETNEKPKSSSLKKRNLENKVKMKNVSDGENDYVSLLSNSRAEFINNNYILANKILHQKILDLSFQEEKRVQLDEEQQSMATDDGAISVEPSLLPTEKRPDTSVLIQQFPSHIDLEFSDSVASWNNNNRIITTASPSTANRNIKTAGKISRMSSPRSPPSDPQSLEFAREDYDDGLKGKWKYDVNIPSTRPTTSNPASKPMTSYSYMSSLSVAEYPSSAVTSVPIGKRLLRSKP
jgi:hypothetical protein